MYAQSKNIWKPNNSKVYLGNPDINTRILILQVWKQLMLINVTPHDLELYIPLYR